MPIRINGLWHVRWCRPNNGIVRALFDLNAGHDDHYFLGNFPREFGEAKVDEPYRIIIMPSFPHELGTNRDGVG